MSSKAVATIIPRSAGNPLKCFKQGRDKIRCDKSMEVVRKDTRRFSATSWGTISIILVRDGGGLGSGGDGEKQWVTKAML